MSWSSSSEMTALWSWRSLRAASTDALRASPAVTRAVSTSVPSAIATMATSSRVRRRRRGAVIVWAWNAGHAVAAGLGDSKR